MTKLSSETQLKRSLARFVGLTLGICLIWTAGKAFGAASTMESRGELVQGKTAQGFRYMSGGVSSEERKLMEARAGEYNLRLTFAAKTGQYIADVRLVIKDEKGREIISAVTEGPWFFIDLPPGNYSIKATFEGQARDIKNVRLSKGKSARQHFQWEVQYGPRPAGGGE